MTLAQLRYLLAIVDGGLNITAAADRANATQSGLSKQLKQLEDQLLLKLFVRRGRALERLTEAGQEIVARARIIVAEADNILALAANQRSSAGGSLSIETTPIQASFVLPDALAALRHRFPEVDVSLGLAADADDAARGTPKADLLMFSTDGRVPAGGVAIPLYRWDPVALVPQNHPLVTTAEPLTLQSLARHPMITYDTSRIAPLSIARTFLEAGLAPRFAFAIRDGAIIKAGVRKALGVGLLAEMAIDPATDGDLHVLPLAGILPRCTAWAVMPHDRVLRGYAAHLLSLLCGLSAPAIQRIAAGEAPPPAASSAPPWSEVERALSRQLAGARAAA